MLMCNEDWNIANTKGSSHNATGNCNNINFLYVDTVPVRCPSTSGDGGGPIYINTTPHIAGGGGIVDNTIIPWQNPFSTQITDTTTTPLLPDLVDNRAQQFYNDLSDVETLWADKNHQSFNEIIQYQIDNNWSPESTAFAKELLTFLTEIDWKTEIKKAISTGITSSAELTHKMYKKLSVIASNHPSSISYINIVIDGIRAAASTSSGVASTTVPTMSSCAAGLRTGCPARGVEFAIVSSSIGCA